MVASCETQKRKPADLPGFVVYTRDGDGYHESELQELLDLPRLKWVKIEDGCAMPPQDVPVLVVNDVGWHEATYVPFASAAICDWNDIHGGDIWGVTHWARVELPKP